MISANLQHLMQQVQTLTPEERQELRQFLDASSPSAPPRTKEDELDELLLKRGIISRIPQPNVDPAAYQNRKRVRIKGKPLSETIIEERR